MSPAGAVCGKWSREANIHVTLTHNNTQSDYMQTRDTQEMFTNHKYQYKLLYVKVRIWNIHSSYVWLLPPVCVMTAAVTHSWHVMNITLLMTAGRGGAGPGADWEWHILAAILQHSPTLQICNNWQRGGTQHHGVTRRTVQYIAFESPVPGPI